MSESTDDRIAVVDRFARLLWAVDRIDLDLEADRATGGAPLQAQHVLTPGGDERDDDPTTWLLGGRYAFDCVRGDEGWLIEGSTMTAIWEMGDTEVFAEAGST
jgi:hypothetical protein